MNYVQGRISGLTHGRMMSFALCVVLAIDNVNGSSSLHPEQGHGYEVVVESKVANLKACDFRDTKACHSVQRGEQPVTVESHQSTHGATFDPTGEDVTAGQRRREAQKIVPMLNSRPG